MFVVIGNIFNEKLTNVFVFFDNFLRHCFLVKVMAIQTLALVCMREQLTNCIAFVNKTFKLRAHFDAFCETDLISPPSS